MTLQGHPKALIYMAFESQYATYLALFSHSTSVMERRTDGQQPGQQLDVRSAKNVMHDAHTGTHTYIWHKASAKLCQRIHFVPKFSGAKNNN